MVCEEALPPPQPLAEASFHGLLAQAAAEYEGLQGRYWALLRENQRLKEELAATPRRLPPGQPAGDLGALRVSASGRARQKRLPACQPASAEGTESLCESSACSQAGVRLEGRLPQTATWLPCSPPLTSRASSPASLSPRRGPIVFLPEANCMVDASTPLLGESADEAVLEPEKVWFPRPAPAPLVLLGWPPRSEASVFEEALTSGRPADESLSTEDNVSPGIVALKVEQFTAQRMEACIGAAPTARGFSPRVLTLSPEGRRALAACNVWEDCVQEWP